MIGYLPSGQSSFWSDDASQRLFAPALSTQTSRLVNQLKAIQHRPSLGVTSPRSSGTRPLEEILFDALAKAKVLASQVAMHLDVEWRSKIFRQLDSLHDLEEWENGDKPIQESSFSTFLKAILDIDPERKPGLGLSSAGHLIAAWTVGKDRLTIEFLENDRVRWVVARSDNGDTERFAGDTNVVKLNSSLQLQKSEHWFKYDQHAKSA